MHATRLTRFIPALVLGLGLAAAPLAVSLDGLDDQVAFAKKGGNGGGKGGGKGGGNGGGNGNGNGGAKSAAADNAGTGASDALASTDDRPGKHLGQVKRETADFAAAAHADDEDGATEIGASGFGRLNGFLNASPNGLANAAPNSAIGVVANAYREALSAYAGGDNEVGDDEAALDAAARAMALAANKEVTAEVVAAVNAHLAETFADDPALAGFADPTSPESLDAAEAIAAAAESYQAEEANQGLGQGLQAATDDGLDGEDSGGNSGDEVADGGDGTALVQ